MVRGSEKLREPAGTTNCLARRELGLEPAYFICLSIARPVVALFPLNYSWRRKRIVCGPVCGQEEDRSSPWPSLTLPFISQIQRFSQCISVQCFATFACLLCLFLLVTLLVLKPLPLWEEILLWQYGQLMCCPPDRYMVQ